jgi:Flp pilus assembly secretin CpaC
LPEEDTTEANTTVLLPDGKGMIIGGLIKESDSEKKSWAPYLGKIPVIKHFFNRSTRESQRVEVILALTPHIVPYTECINLREGAAYQAATNTTGIIAGDHCLSCAAAEESQPKMGGEPIPAPVLPGPGLPMPGLPMQGGAAFNDPPPNTSSPLFMVPALPFVP